VPRACLLIRPDVKARWQAFQAGLSRCGFVVQTELSNPTADDLLDNLEPASACGSSSAVRSGRGSRNCFRERLAQCRRRNQAHRTTTRPP
jgi:hypothetical protein